MGKTKRNVSGLLHHAATLKADTEEKVNSAIDSLKRSKSKKINFKTVSETSGISTTTLYNNPVLRARISSLRAVQIQSAQKNSAHRISEREKIRLLQQEIQNLKGDKKMLIEQLVEMEQLKAENKQLKELLSIRKLELRSLHFFWYQAVKFIQMRWFYKLFTMCSLLLTKDNRLRPVDFLTTEISCVMLYLSKHRRYRQ